jgi:hypothetical protein
MFPCREHELFLYEVTLFESSKAYRFIAHGTTVATNAMLQEQWAKVGLITNKGFRDVLEIGTQLRPELYGLQQKKPVPLVTRDLRMEAGCPVPFGANLKSCAASAPKTMRWILREKIGTRMQ